MEDVPAVRIEQAAAGGLLAAVAALGGCGDDPATDGGDESSTDTVPEVRSCDLITVEEVNGLVGSPVTSGPDQSGDTCQWLARTAGGIGVMPAQHLVELTVMPPISTLEGMLDGVDGEAEPVTDLGDEAQLVVGSPSAVAPAVIAGYSDSDRIVTLKYEVQNEDVDVDLRPHGDALVELLRRVDRRVTGDQPP